MLSRTIISAGRKKLQAWIKFPDTVILYGNAKYKLLLNVIFNIDFTKEHNDLFNNAR